MYLRHVNLLLHYHRNSHKTRSYLHIKQSDIILIEGWDTLTFSFKDSCSCVSLLALARRSTRQNSHSRLLYLTPENCTTTAPLPDIFKNLKTKLYPTKLAKKKHQATSISVFYSAAHSSQNGANNCESWENGALLTASDIARFQHERLCAE